MVVCVEVKIIRKMDYLPNVFLDSYLNKFALIGNLTEKIENCAKYESRSGLTFAGCLKSIVLIDRIKIEETKETRGIYYVPNEPIITLSFRQKAIRSMEDLKYILSTLDFSKVSLKQPWVLISYTNYWIRIYDIYYKGLRYEFPILGEQGHLRVYQVPPIRNAYLIFYENNQERREINKELFSEVKEFMVYNHKVIFSQPVMEFKNLFITPGGGALVYAQDSTKVRLESPDHKEVEFSLNKDTWILFSHSRPSRNKAD